MKLRDAKKGQNLSNSETTSIEQLGVNEVCKAPFKYSKVVDLFIDIVMISSMAEWKVSDGLKVKCSWCTSANKLLRTIGLIAKVTTTGRNIRKMNLILFVDILITLKKMETDDEENGIKEIVTKIGSKSFRKNNFSALERNWKSWGW